MQAVKKLCNVRKSVTGGGALSGSLKTRTPGLSNKTTLGPLANSNPQSAIEASPASHSLFSRGSRIGAKSNHNPRG